MSGKFLFLDKTHSISSFKFISPLKRLYKKVGHTGTLDPFATGLLVVAVDRATKFIRFLPKDKEYLFSVQFGLKTDSDDLDGKIIEQNSLIPSFEQIQNALFSFVGWIKQRPNQFSAVKINGVRSYKLARAGVCCEVPLRDVFVQDLKLLRFENGVADFKVNCLGGTYVRSLMSDICQNIGCLGCVVSLRRTISNGFLLNLENTEIDLECFFDFYPKVILNEDQIYDLKFRNIINFENFKDGVFSVSTSSNSFIGLMVIFNKKLFEFVSI